MKKASIALLLCCGFLSSAQATDWVEDSELSGFETTTLSLQDDYDGVAIATVIRQRNSEDSQKAVLYIHGYSDYFFQEEMAQKYLDNGYNFYAIDLRKYGRSISENTLHPNMMKDISEYDEEITKAITLIRGEEGNTQLLLAGHSTGGLIGATYANKFKADKTIDAVFLNSPYLNKVPTGASAIMALGLTCPFCELPTPPNLKVYGQSISDQYYGEWDFNLDWKPVGRDGGDIPVYAGWLRAVYMAQHKVKEGLDIEVPILVMHSKYSYKPLFYTDKASTMDTVLVVDEINEYADYLGDHVTKIRVDGGLHDLVLSEQSVRDQVYYELFRWLDGYLK
ncbi:alpha/beta hydrolase [Vibrio sp. Of7-15]|uniref:alpha/beta hydrolase n=1 Tax=Vibrio sp. Of7-15 TaxID=2724879 RepID=UPI001EF167C2|nr:alpha/beta hydrolase [Vibrio sp. Of7-15]MCG7496429.1 alpha/beta hydrolase [Vibrio sp. Of7-15]